MIAIVFMLASLGLVALAVGLAGAASVVWSGSAMLLVIGGTLCVTGISCEAGDGAALAGGLRRLFSGKRPDLNRANAILLDLAARVRRDGPHILDHARLGLRSLPFIDQGVAMVADAQPVEVVEATLAARIEEIAANHMRVAHIFRRAGDVAPALGLIGTLIGLVQMLTKLDNPDALGAGMGLALLTTLYGAIAAHILFFPIAARAESLCDSEVRFHRLCMAGILGLARRDHPLLLEQQLERSATLTPHAAAA